MRVAMGVSSFKASARELWADTSGVILPYVTLMLVVIIGVSVLAIDGARVMSLQTQLQRAADALALAGAGELDQTSTSITRSTNAINNTVSNGTLAGLGNQTVAVSSIRFLASLPASDATPIAGGNVTTDPLDAKYVEVTVQPVTLTNILPASFFGGVNSKTLGAVAVAGRGAEVVCGIPPVFVCNPHETAGMSDDQATDALKAAVAIPANARRQLKLNADNTGPGQFGWLVPPDGCTGAACLGDWIGRVHPNACYKKADISLNTGQKQSANAGFNVRFDLYEGGSPLNAYSSEYAPSVNVRKAYVWHNPNWCHATPVGSGTTYYNNATIGGLPRDSSFANNFMGNGAWNCLSYWTRNHVAAAPAGCNSTTPTISRYDVYRYEIAQNLVGDWSGNRLQKLSNSDPGTGESGRPYCSGQGNGVDTTTGSVDRRLIFAAVVNCLANGPFPPGSNATHVPVAAFGKFFMTQPIFADGDSTRPLYAEMVGLATLGDGITEFVPVQLYR